MQKFYSGETPQIPRAGFMAGAPAPAANKFLVYLELLQILYFFCILSDNFKVLFPGCFNTQTPSVTQVWLGRQSQVWFISLADESGVCR